MSSEIKKPSIDFHAQRSIELTQRIRELEADLPDAVTDFIRAMLTSSSVLTRLAYCYDLRLFFRFLSQENRAFADVPPKKITCAMLDGLTLRDIEMYQEYLTMYVRTDENGQEDLNLLGEAVFVQNHEIGIARKMSSLRSFFKYLHSHELIHQNVAALAKMPKIHSKPIIYLEREEISRLFDVIASGEGLTRHQQAYNEKFRLRDIAIISLLLGTGIRESELVGMDLDDVDLANNSFLVVRKGGNEVILYFNDQVKDALWDYMEQRSQIEPVPGHEQALFLSSQRKRINARSIQFLVKKYAAVAVPLKRKMSPHKLRATFATNLYREKRDIYMVSAALSHQQVSTSARYTERGADERRQAAAGVTWVPGHSEEPAMLPPADSPSADDSGETLTQPE